MKRSFTNKMDKLGLVALAIIGAALILWIEGPGWKLDKDQAAFWDIALKSIAGIVGVSGAWVALSKYFFEKEKSSQAALIEAQKPFQTKRQEVYYELVSATATIGNKDKDDKLRQDAEAAFWQLY